MQRVIFWVAVAVLASTEACSRLSPCRSQIDNITQQLNSIGEALNVLTQRIDDMANELEDLKEAANCTGGGATDCPADWLPYNGSCYFFQQSKIELSQDAANESCTFRDSRSYLVAVETAGEFHFLKTHLVDIYPTIQSNTSNGWLTSGRHVGGHWLWTSTGSPVHGSALTWGPGEPAIYDDCLTFWPWQSFNMATSDCSSYQRQYICEM